jgi:hypothetical protein
VRKRRYVPISPYIFRQTASEYTIAKGTDHATTVFRQLRAGRDAVGDVRQKAFEDPDQFIPGRNWYHYFISASAATNARGDSVGMVMIPKMVRQIPLRPGLRPAAHRLRRRTSCGEI